MKWFGELKSRLARNIPYATQPLQWMQWLFRWTCKLFCVSNLFLLAFSVLYFMVGGFITLQVLNYNPQQSIYYPLNFRYGRGVDKLDDMVRVRQRWFIRQIKAYKQSKVHLRQMMVEFDVLNKEDRSIQLELELLNAKNETLYLASRSFMNEPGHRGIFSLALDTFNSYIYYPHFKNMPYQRVKRISIPFVLESDLDSMEELNQKISNTQWIKVQMDAISNQETPKGKADILKTFDAQIVMIGELNGLTYFLYYHWFIVWMVLMVIGFGATSGCLSTCCCLIVFLKWRKSPGQQNSRMESFILEEDDEEEDSGSESDTQSVQSDRTAVHNSTPRQRSKDEREGIPAVDREGIPRRRRPIRRQSGLDDVDDDL